MNADTPGNENVVITNTSHQLCVVCGRDNDSGLHLEFSRGSDGSVTTTFPCDRMYQGYPDVLHGGIVAAILDGAMTNCLFAHKVTAVTAEMTVRYLLPVQIGRPATARAWVVKSSPHLQILAAELVQDGDVRATAQAKFLNRKSAQSTEASH